MGDVIINSALIERWRHESRARHPCPIVLPAPLYDELERQHYDMAPYTKQMLIPTF